MAELYMGSVKTLGLGDTIKESVVDLAEITDYINFFRDGARMDLYEIANPKNCLNLTYAFANNDVITSFSSRIFNTSKCMAFDHMFYSAKNLKEVTLDMSCAEYANSQYMFYNCTSLEKLIVTECKTELSYQVLYGSGTNKTLPSVTTFLIPEGFNGNVYTALFPNITQECLHENIERLSTIPFGINRSFRCGAEILAKIDEEHIKMLEEKNYNYS